jgi:CRP-like cAMP-binding protein
MTASENNMTAVMFIRPFSCHDGLMSSPKGSSINKCLNRDCASCVDSIDHLFTGLPEAALKEISKSKSTHRYARGQAVFYSGNTPLGLFCVNQGIIKLESLSSDGKTHLLRVVSKGGVLGYRSLFSNEPYHATAIVNEDSEVCLIPRETFMKLTREYPEFMMRIVSKLSVELREAENRLESMADKEAPERVAEAVIYFKDHFPTQNWTRKELADWAGTSAETVMRVLAKFEEQGMIEQKGRVITVLQKQKLLDFANVTD